MKQTLDRSGWSTTSFGGAADTSPMELDALGEHLSTCRGQQGRFPELRCAAERVHGYVSSRIVTSLVVFVTLLLGIGSLALRGGVMWSV